MAAEDCIAEIKAAAGRDLTDDEIEQILERVERRRQQRLAANRLESADQAYAQAAKDVADETKTAAIIEKRSAAINILTKLRRDDFYARYRGKESEGLSTLNVGSEKAIAGAAASVSAQQKGLRADLIGPMVAELRRANLIEIVAAKHPDLERDAARNMWEITQAAIEGRKPALSGTEQSRELARILVKYQETARQMQNDAGAWIGRLPGYIVRQSHDMFRIRRAGQDAWKSHIAPLLDRKTFDDLDIDPADGKAVDEFLNVVWSELASGEHYRERGADDYLGGFRGPGNLAKRMSQHRVLHFKSADDWLAYNDRFGMGGLMEGVIHGLQKAADNTALMRTWGTNPEAAFQADIDRLAEQATRTGDVTMAKKLRGWRIRSEMDQLTGAAKIPGNPTWAQYGSFTRALLNMSSLGGVVLSSIPDNALKAAALRHHGIGLLQGHADAMADLFRGRGSGEKREIADHLAAGIDGMLGDIAARWSAEDTLPGKMARMQNWFFKLNLMNFWVDAKSTGAGLIMAHNLARNVDKDFGGLDPLLQTTLRRYGIGQDQWTALRQANMRLDGETAYLLPEAIDQLPDTALRPLANGTDNRAIQRARDDLRLALRTFYAEELAVINTWGGARERAITTWGTQPGTPQGEAVRFIMQFKMFPITFATRHLAREFTRGGIPGVAHMVLATTALGYVANSAKEIAKGREPRPLDAEHWDKTLTAAAVQGGGLGIYGDFLFGEYNRFGGGALETLAGPGVGKASEILRAFAGARAGEPADAIADITKASINTLPGVNLFYTRAALDYLILYQMQEFASPGYLRRMEQRIARENGQRFILPPSSQIPYGGGSRLFEGVR